MKLWRSSSTLFLKLLENCLIAERILVLLQGAEFSGHFFCCYTTTQHARTEHEYIHEIEAVFNEVGLFLHSFFFTAELVSATEMYQTVLVLLERISIVQVKIKDECIVVSKKLSYGIGSLQVAEASSQDKSISMVEEIIVGFENMTKQIASHLREGKKCLQIISIVGMPGLGETTLAKEIYNDFKLSSHLDMLSWCVVSQTYKKRKLLIDILSFVSNLNGDEILEKEDEDSALCRYRNLKALGNLQFSIILKLNGTNHKQWVESLMMNLTIMKLDLALREDSPPEPTVETFADEKKLMMIGSIQTDVV